MRGVWWFFFPPQRAALFRLERSAGLQLLKLLAGSPSRSRYNTETCLHGPAREPPVHSLSLTQSLLCLFYYPLLVLLFHPAFLFFIHLTAWLSHSLSRWGPSISQMCYFNPTLAVLHPKAPKGWLAQYNGRQKIMRNGAKDRDGWGGEERRGM